MAKTRRKSNEKIKSSEVQIDGGTVSIAGGTALGALAVGELALLGVACPICIIGAPALLGYGAYSKIRKKRKTKVSTKQEKTS